MPVHQYVIFYLDCDRRCKMSTLVLALIDPPSSCLELRHRYPTDNYLYSSTTKYYQTTDHIFGPA